MRRRMQTIEAVGDVNSDHLNRRQRADNATRQDPCNNNACSAAGKRRPSITQQYMNTWK
jgi:hypothetical protein